MNIFIWLGTVIILERLFLWFLKHFQKLCLCRNIYQCRGKYQIYDKMKIFAWDFFIPFQGKFSSINHSWLPNEHNRPEYIVALCFWIIPPLSPQKHQFSFLLNQPSEIWTTMCYTNVFLCNYEVRKLWL